MAEDKSKPKPKDYVLVTRVTPIREGGKAITHAYGPYTKDQAVYNKTKTIADARRIGYLNRITVSVCKMLDPELANG
jgi:hypothetical protein